MNALMQFQMHKLGEGKIATITAENDRKLISEMENLNVPVGSLAIMKAQMGLQIAGRGESFFTDLITNKISDSKKWPPRICVVSRQYAPNHVFVNGPIE
jgi:hypothetical protein